MSSEVSSRLVPIQKIKSDIVDLNIAFPRGLDVSRIGIDIVQLETLCKVAGISRFIIETRKSHVDEISPGLGFLESLYLGDTSESAKDMRRGFSEDPEFRKTLNDIAREVEKRMNQRSVFKKVWSSISNTAVNAVLGERKVQRERGIVSSFDEQGLFSFLSAQEHGATSPEAWVKFLNHIILRKIKGEGTQWLLTPTGRNIFGDICQLLFMTWIVSPIDPNRISLFAILSTLVLCFPNLFDKETKPERLSFLSLGGVELEEALVLWIKILQTRQLVGIITSLDEK